MKGTDIVHRSPAPGLAERVNVNTLWKSLRSSTASVLVGSQSLFPRSADWDVWRGVLIQVQSLCCLQAPLPERCCAARTRAHCYCLSPLYGIISKLGTAVDWPDQGLTYTATEMFRVLSIPFSLVEIRGKMTGNLHGFLGELFSSWTACGGVGCVCQQIIVIFICKHKSIKLPLTIIKIWF